MELTLWHGGRNLENSYREFKPAASGRWEHGPGLYLTNRFDTASKYAKGGGKIYKVAIDFDPNKSVNRVGIPVSDVLDFVKFYAKKSELKNIIADIDRNTKDDGTIKADILVNLMLNYNALTSTKTVRLSEFLQEHGVQYGVTRYGGRDEVVVIVYDRSIIKSVKPVRSKDVPTDE